MANCEILVYKKNRNSSREGKLVLGDKSVIATGVNIRAAGGQVVIGCNSGIGEHTVIVASNHIIQAGIPFLNTKWDEQRVDVIVGDNVWVGALTCLLPGTRIGSNTVIGAGSVVRGVIPANEIWAGVPARKIKDVPAAPDIFPQERA